MLGPTSVLGRVAPVLPWLAIIAAVGLWTPAGGQELPLKRDLPGSGPYICPEIEMPEETGPEERAQARRLASDASQAMILGDMERARDLLARATEVDPASPDLAYQLGRILEDLGDRPGGIAQFCRVLFLGQGMEELGDAYARLQSLVEGGRVEIPREAVDAFEEGLNYADSGNHDRAVVSFGLAFEAAPDWADAVYNRGVVQARMGQNLAAISDLQEYLALRPNALDAIEVSQRIGQLESSGRLPSPGTALALGVFPGMGQFYSSRPLGGFTVLGLAGAAVATGFLVEKVTVRCLGVVSSGDDCPPDRVLGETSEQPYMMAALGVAAVVTVAGAIEAFVKAKRFQSGLVREPEPEELGRFRLLRPSIIAHGRRIDLQLVRVAF
jgi:tetratricopeptide (TPR) repeat protein